MTLESLAERVERGEFFGPSLSGLTKTDTIFDLNKSLIRNKDGDPRPLLANVLAMLRCHSAWQGVLAFNQFSKFVVTKRTAPWHVTAGQNWSDNDDSLCTEWMQHQGICVNSSKVVAEAVQTVARENSFHPVCDYLRSLEWDTKPRITFWLSTYLGSQETTWTRAVGPRWLISAIARVDKPGCQVDHTLLLEGPQGVRKSTALRTLAGDEWFADHNSDLGNKDSMIELHGKWIFEMSELAHIRGKEIQTVKAFLSRRTDRLRLPYSRRAEDVPRSCVFAASVNDETPLTDETGNRRFWPIKCGSIDIHALTRDRDQIWAEAYQSYKTGFPWWLDSAALNEEARKEQDERYEADVWDDIVLPWCDSPTIGKNASVSCVLDSAAGRVTITEILVHAIGKDLDRLEQKDRNRVVRCLIHDGWTRVRDWSRGPNRGKWFYEKKEAEVRQ